MGTVSRIILDAQGDPSTIVHPTNDIELNQSCFTGPIQVDVPRFDYDLAEGNRGLFLLLKTKLIERRPILASILQTRVDIIDAVDQLQIDRDTRERLIEQFGDTPTNPQKIILAANAAKIGNDINTLQALRDSLALLVQQL